MHRKNIPIYIQQDATLHNLLYLETALHVSGGTTTHYQEHIQLYLQHLVFVTPLLLPAAKLCKFASCWMYIGMIFLVILLPFLTTRSCTLQVSCVKRGFNPLNPELNPICYLLAILGAHHFLHVSRIKVKLLNFRLLMSYIYIWSTHS